MTPFRSARRAGVLCPLSAIPAAPQEPVSLSGTLGPGVLAFMDRMAHAGLATWQVLPLNPVDDAGSPYNSASAFALDPGMISPVLLSDWHLGELTPTLCDVTPDLRRKALRTALCESMAGHRGMPDALRTAFGQFRHREHHWLRDHALFELIKTLHGSTPWTHWPLPLRDRHPTALRDLVDHHACLHDALCLEQFLAHTQWQRAHSYARKRGLEIIGDLPVFVSHDSADVWAHRDLFQLDDEGHPMVIAGVPPDRFAPDGQTWGMPLYDWDPHRASHFAWWTRRLVRALDLHDRIRLDHFIGLIRCWTIPAGRDARHGRWMPAGGRELLSTWARQTSSLRLIAEDLGALDNDVTDVRDEFGLPGMRVLQFAFDGDASNPHLPHHHCVNSIVYTGTHDNHTTLGWWQQAPDDERMRAMDYLGHPANPMPDALIRATLASVSSLAIIPLQDWLGLDDTARLNVPGQATGQWRWVAPGGQPDLDRLLTIQHWLRLYGRASQPLHQADFETLP